jgi:SOS response regulatory protein OraA/RecX
VIESSLARITELGLLDDRAYACRRALLMAERGYGDYAIRLFLQGLGIPEEMSYDAVQSIPEELDETKRISVIVEKRKDLPREKLIRFLAGRGFPLDLIIDLVGGVDA